MTRTLSHRSRAVLLASLAALAAAAACAREAEPAAAKQVAPTAVEVEAASETEIADVRRLTGDVLPWEIVPLSFKVGGKLARVLVEEGDAVRSGDLVATLDSLDYRLTRDLAKAQVAALAPHLARAEQLLAQEALPQAKLDELASQMDLARIQKSQADAQLSYARLTSPLAGVVIRKLGAAGSLTGPTYPVVVIGRLSTAKVVLPAAQRDLGLFSVGQKIPLRAPGLEQRFVGEVRGIGYAADERTRTFPITLAVDNPDLLLRAGMIVEAEVETARRRGILIPLDAVSQSLAGRPSVLVVDRKTGLAASREVALGSLAGERVEIRAGLAVGERVIVKGLAAAGDPVVEATARARNGGGSR